MTNNHIPVMLDQVLEYLPTLARNIFDGTFGGGGYTAEFLKKASVVASDLDQKALDIGQERFKKEIEMGKLKLVHASYHRAITDIPLKSLDYIVLDLGFSTNQLDFSGRGFSYLHEDEPVDLRYDQSRGKACYELLKIFPKPEEFFKIIYQYSGEALSKPLADNIMIAARHRKNTDSPLTVGELVETIKEHIPAKFKKNQNAILSRVWQALRIWTNRELENLESFLPQAYDRLAPGGRLCIVSFHSLEDKIVTSFMRQMAAPIILDDYGNKDSNAKLLTKKFVAPSVLETEKNTRARSARLRVLERL